MNATTTTATPNNTITIVPPLPILPTNCIVCGKSYYDAIYSICDNTDCPSKVIY